VSYATFYTTPMCLSVAGSNVAVTVSDVLNVLGVTLDSTLTFDDYANNVVRSCNFHLRALRHLRPRLSLDVAKTMAAIQTCTWVGFIHGLDWVQNCRVRIFEMGWVQFLEFINFFSVLQLSNCVYQSLWFILSLQDTVQSEFFR